MIILKNDRTQDVFLVGAKSLGAYGGYETFIDKLTEYHQHNKNIQYHVACKANGEGSMDPYQTEGAQIVNDKEFIYHNARCFRIPIPNIGPAQAIYYDLAALNECCNYITNNNIINPIIYIMACRIGPFIQYFYNKIHKLGGKIFINPDGHEWMRAKWSKPIRWYWKFSEKLMVKYSDLVICDSKTIENYIHSSYDGFGVNGSSPKTTFIAYGAETRKSYLEDDDEKVIKWYDSHGLEFFNYYLIVGRFVPENNYETIIREFMSSNSKKFLVIITNTNEKLMRELEEKLNFNKDPRIKFVGTVYDSELLLKIRENAYAYIHGHEVGGTNPSLLEALGSTKLNLLLDVGFNKEVAMNTAFYWSKDSTNLSGLLNKVELLSEEKIDSYGNTAKERIRYAYSWEKISNDYLSVFANNS